jgi:hypothetical protein
MNALRLAALVVLAGLSLNANAASFVPSDLDCTKILQKWAENPDSVPRNLVDLCKEKMAVVAPLPPAAIAAAPGPAAQDPCTGPDAAASVLCWGPWSTLAPAAVAPMSALEIPDYPGDCEYGSELADQCVALLAPLEPQPLEGCTPGTPCGFATVVDGVTSHGDVEETEFARIDVAPDGTSFAIRPGEEGEIASVAMMTNIQPRNDGYENMRSNGIEGDEQSRLVARIVRGDSGDLELAADVWGHGNRETRIAQSGFFAWGNATSSAGLDALNGNGVSLSYSGPMSVNNATNAAMTVAFGTNPTWTGTWTNPAWSFGAGGTVTGVNMISRPEQFTGNVQSGFVQGALLGEPGRGGIAHIIDVTLEGQGRIKDVGLLR